MKNRKALALFAILALVAAACGGTADEVVEEEVVDPDASPEDGEEETTDSDSDQSEDSGNTEE